MREIQKMFHEKGKLQHKMHDTTCIKHKKWKYIFVNGEEILGYKK